MIYFDGWHLASPDLQELHAFAARVGIKRCWYEGFRKGHPHYDITSEAKAQACLEAGAILVTSRELIRLCFKEK